MKVVNKAASELGRMSWEKNKDKRDSKFFKWMSKLGVEKKKLLKQQKNEAHQASSSEDQV